MYTLLAAPCFTLLFDYLLVTSVMFSSSGGSLGFTGKCHNPFLLLLLPFITNFPWKYTLHSCLLNFTLQPASQHFLVDINDECDNPGTMCASVLLCGNHGICRLHVCADVIVCPSRSVMVIGCRSTHLLTTGAPSTMKLPVAPESKTA